jgi:hypothetical protein
MRKSNIWSAKAHALDRYRWKLLRQRHGIPGSSVRFLRDAFKDLIFGICAHFRLANPDIDASACDFLLLQSAPKVIRFQRKKRLIETLRQRQHRLVETALDVPSALLSSRRLCHPNQSVPLRYFGYAAHAQWLVRHYRPHIVLNDRNGSYFAPFLRLALDAVDAKLVQLAHATTLETSSRLGMNDYHYYFLFGRSSLDALLRRKLIFGTSTAVIAGSYMIDEAYRLPPPTAERRTLLVLGVGPDKEKLEGYRRTYALLLEWAVAHPEYQVMVKAHPRSSMAFWNDAQGLANNLTVLPSTITLAEALSQASLIINIMSNAVIEAGLSGRPILYVNCAQDNDVFGQAQFFPGPIRDGHTLTKAIETVERDYPMYCQNSLNFSKYHIEHGQKGLDINIEALERILRGNPLTVYCSVIPESLS